MGGRAVDRYLPTQRLYPVGQPDQPGPAAGAGAQDFRDRLCAEPVLEKEPGRPALRDLLGQLAQLQGGRGSAIPLFIRADFASATQAVLYAMAAIMALAALVALRGLRRGVQDGEHEPAAALVPAGR